jgi:hypothetical protein
MTTAAARIIIAALELPPEYGEIGLVRHGSGDRRGQPVEPQEIWCLSIACWVRVDGTCASFDRGRGWVNFGPDDQRLIALACASWKALNP